ncbi:MAG: ABC transporter permease [bacterium]
MPFPLFLALKYLKPKRSFISVVTIISIVGVMLGVAILVIVMSIMTGFDDMWNEKIQGFAAHLTILPRAGGTITNDEQVLSTVRKMKGVTGAAQHVQTVVLVQRGDESAAPFLMGIEPDGAETVSKLPGSMVEGKFDLSEGNVVVGVDLARRLGLGIGSKVVIYSPRCVMVENEIRLPDELTVSGIFELGMWDFDSVFIIASLETAREMCGMERGSMAIRVMTDDPSKASELGDRIEAALGPEYMALTWMDMNKTLFDTLKVEKGMMFLLLTFVTIVAMFTVTVTLLLIGVQKTDEIGLLKAMGFAPLQIMSVFIWHGWIQSVVGVVCGICAGKLCLHYRHEILQGLSSWFGIDLFPKSIYLLSEIPSHTTPGDVITISLSVFVLCTLASIVPASRAAALRPVDALRHE